MKLRISALIFGTLFLAFLLRGQQSPNKNTNPKSPLKKTIDYKQSWKKVDSLAERDLPKSALPILENIYAKAKAEGNTNELIKSLLYMLRLENALNENAEDKSYRRLKNEIAKSDFPTKAILQSVLAQQLENYFNAHRWNILSQTKLEQKTPDSLNQWNVLDFEREIKNYYLQSISEKNRLQKEPVRKYETILQTQTGSDTLRPTLYDLLAFRALNYFSSSQQNNTNAEQENITQLQLLTDAKAFSALDIYAIFPKLDKMDKRLQALAIYQEIIRFHLADKNPAALVDADLSRLKYAFDILTTEEKNDAYYKALLQIENAYKTNEASAEAGFTRAQFVLIGYKPKDSDANSSLQKIALQICENYITKFPNSFGGKNCASLKATILTNSFSIKTEKTYLPENDIKLKLEYKNVSQVYYRINKISPELFLENSYSYSLDSATFANLVKLNSLQQKQVNLVATDDYLQHSTEIAIDKLGFGIYAVLVSANKDFSWEDNQLALSKFVVTNLSATAENRPEKNTLLYVRDAKNGSPIKAAEVKIFLQNYNNTSNKWERKLAETKTSNKDGIVEISPNPQSAFTFEIKKVNDFLPVAEGINVNDYYAPEQQQTRTFFFTDRSIYRPGQTVYFKGIRLQNNADGSAPKIISNHNTTVYFHDVNGQQISQKDFTTNEFGSFNGTFSIPSNLLSGNMSIRDDAGEVSIQIEEYKRPQFEVKLDTLKSSFRLNEKIIQTGKATTYSGAALNNATVKYRVQRQAIFPIWMWWKPYLFSPAAEITNGTTTTDGNGNFKFDFTALPDLKIAAKDKPEFSYTITTDVTSQSGETQSTQTIINIGYTALRAEISIPELLDNSAAQTLQINTSNLSGQKVNVNGNVKIEKLEEPNQALRSRLWEAPDKPVLSRDEYKKHFPQDVYMDEDKVYNYPVEKTINEQSLSSNSAINFTEQEMKNWSAGNYKITCTAKDVFGETVESIKYIKVYDAKSKKAAFVTPSYFIAHKASNLKPGEKAVFIWGTAAKASAHIVAAHKGKVVFDKWISSKGGQQRIEIPVTEEYRGGLFVKLTTMIDNRLYQYSEKSDVPFPDRKLEITTAVWRDKTKPGAKETWTFNIKGPNAEKAVAEMLAGMYDASLDAFVPHKWNFEIDPYTYPMIYINALGLGGVNEGFSRYDGYGNNFSGWQLRSYDELIYNENQGFGGRIIFNLNQVRDGAYRNIKSMAKTSNGVIGETSFSPPTLQDQSQEMQQKPPTQIRKNKQETVFFYPQLRTNESGDVSFEFTMPDALTRWKFMAFAHTKDLKFGTYESAIITQKELMVQPNLPRFLRAGDEIEFSANATNLSGETQKGEVRIKLFDAYSMKYLGDEILENKTLENKTSAQQSISLKNGETKNIVWKIKTPANTDGIMYQLIASAGKFSDGEEGVIPVLPNRMLVTETQPLYVRGNASKTFNFNPLLNLSKSKTAAPYKLTMEIASNPAWFAVQSLPYLMENPYENAENVFNRLFANTLSQQIVKNNPQIKQVFESWKSGTALQSDLEKNTELKNILLQETPWLAEGRNETERKQRIGLLFDENNMNMNLENAVSKLEQMQQPDGGWPWFDGMQTDRFITQYIITGLGRIEKMEIRNDYMERMRAMMIKAVIYMDEQMLADHENIKKIHPKTVDENHLSSIIVQYFYARSYFKMVPMQRKYQYAYVYWQKQGKKYWTSLNLQQKAMYALALNMIDNDHDAHEIIESINEYALHSEEMGMYWKENTTGYNWHQQPTVTQSILIEAFNDIEDDKAAVEEMKLWLLKQKQTQSWESTKATADAVYALLMNGTNSLATQKNVKVFLGDKLYIPSPEIKTEQGTGYYKTSWSGKEIKPEQGKIKLEKQDDGAAWGAMYYQYFEDINAVKANSGSLSITKDLFIKENSPNGPVLKPISASQPLKTGDLVTVRIRVKTDRNMEYVHVKDMRAAALEPTETISGYQWKSNLGYYQSVKDASMNFFIGYLPKGEYTFEYTLRASQAGTFTNGISQVQCFYAPQFSGQSGSVKLNIK